MQQRRTENHTRLRLRALGAHSKLGSQAPQLSSTSLEYASRARAVEVTPVWAWLDRSLLKTTPW